MPELLLKLSDGLYQKVKTEIGIKKMCDGLCSIPDNLVLAIVGAIENEKDELDLSDVK